MKFYLVETQGLSVPRSAPFLPEDMRHVGQYAYEQARVRVQSRGVGSSGSRMSPYSDDYRKRRARKGRQTAFRDLHVTGRFWLSLRVLRASKGAVTYGWATARGKTLADAHNQRDVFLAPTRREQEQVREQIATRLGMRLPSMQYTRPAVGRKVGR